jgi:predicted small metal-binding protein
MKAIKLTSSGKAAQGGYMRALDCDCGRHLQAANDEELFDKVQEHVSRDHHPEMQLRAEQVREIVAEKAYDDKKPDIWAGIDIAPRAAAYMGAGGMPPSSTRPETRQKRQDRARAKEKQEGKEGLIDKIKDKLMGW